MICVELDAPVQLGHVLLEHTPVVGKGWRIYEQPSRSDPLLRHAVIHTWDGYRHCFACTCTAYQYREDRIRDNLAAPVCAHIREVAGI